MSDELTNKKLLKRMILDMYYNLTIKDISNIALVVNVANRTGKSTSKVNCKDVVFKLKYPKEGDHIYDYVDFSYYNRKNGLFISSSEIIMVDLVNSIKQVYAKAVNDL